MLIKRLLYASVLTLPLLGNPQRLTHAQIAHLPPGWDKSVCIVKAFIADTTEKGTGFFVTNNLDSIFKYDTFLVTNKHVIESADSLRLTYYDLDSGVVSKTFNFKRLEQESLVIVHPDHSIDVGVVKLIFGIKVNSYLISAFKNFDKLSLSEEVYFFGYPFGVNLRSPILRRGIISFKSNETLSIKTRGVNRVVAGGVFLIDGFAWEGNSGSPVVSPGYVLPELGNKYIPYGLLGIVFAYVPTYNSANSGLAIALPCDRIREVLDLFKKR